MDLAAAAANCRCSRVVYVGNIAFHTSEKEVRDTCELIGPVRSFNVAAEGATGKCKGYPFVEYPDDATAQSACRNLHGHLLRGRELQVGPADRARGRRRRGDGEPVGLKDAVHAASLVSGRPSVIASVTRYLATASRHQLREGAAEFESHGPEACKALKERVPGLYTAMELVQRLLDMAAADDAAEEARKKKRASASACAGEGSDHRAKPRKVEDDGKASGVACV